MARREQSLAAYELTIQNAFREVEDALITVQTSREAEQSFERRVASLRTASRWHGRATIMAIPTISTCSILSAACFRRSCRCRRHAATPIARWSDLYRALGGDWIDQADAMAGSRANQSKPMTPADDPRHNAPAADDMRPEAPAPPEPLARSRPDQSEADAMKPCGRARPRRSAPANPVRKIILIVLGSLLALYVYNVVSDRMTPYTSQATIDTLLVQIAPEVTGQVMHVGVTDNGRVKKGQVLFRIDPEPFEIALRKAEADLAVALQAAGRFDR